MGKNLKSHRKKIERWLNPYNEISQRIEPLHPRHENAIIAMQDVSIYDAFFVGVILFSEKTEKHSGIEHLVLYIVNRKENLEISEICLDTMEEKPESPEAVQSSIYEYLRTPCLFWKIKKQKDGKYKIEPMFDTLY
jgi:hypothetical protein